MRATFFKRAAEDLSTYDSRIYAYGEAVWAVNRIKNALFTDDNLKLGQAYIDALFHLNKTNSGPELAKLILFTLEDIKNEVIDAGNFYFNPELLPFKLEVMNTVSEGLAMYFKSRDDKADAIIAALKQIQINMLSLDVDVKECLKSLEDASTDILGALNNNRDNANTAANEITATLSHLEQALSGSGEWSQKTLEEIKGYLDSVIGSLNTISKDAKLHSKALFQQVNHIEEEVSSIDNKISVMDGILVAAKEIKESIAKHQWIYFGLAILATFSVALYFGYRWGRRDGRTEYNQNISGNQSDETTRTPRNCILF
jgi:ElaB/YqjD/DUF883 family membrane-anchored ribosome-binding protein